MRSNEDERRRQPRYKVFSPALSAHSRQSIDLVLKALVDGLSQLRSKAFLRSRYLPK
jgi:hypothetical protein